MTVTEEERRELKEAFDFNDSDSNGKIDFVEFLAMLEGLEAEIDTAQAQFGFKAVDTDGDGTISFDEFVEWWRAT
jgi:Ca2+-binding EF-hand superfamily protein